MDNQSTRWFSYSFLMFLRVSLGLLEEFSPQRHPSWVVSHFSLRKRLAGIGGHPGERGWRQPHRRRNMGVVLYSMSFFVDGNYMTHMTLWRLKCQRMFSAVKSWMVEGLWCSTNLLVVASCSLGISRLRPRCLHALHERCLGKAAGWTRDGWRSVKEVDHGCSKKSQKDTWNETQDFATGARSSSFYKQSSTPMGLGLEQDEEKPRMSDVSACFKQTAPCEENSTWRLLFLAKATVGKR